MADSASAAGVDDLLEADIVDRNVCEWCNRSFLHENPCLKRRGKFPLLQRRAPRSRECVLCFEFKTYCRKCGAERTSAAIRANHAQYRQDLFKFEEEKLAKSLTPTPKSRGSKRPRPSAHDGSANIDALAHGSANIDALAHDISPPLEDIEVDVSAALCPAEQEFAVDVDDASEMLSSLADAFSRDEVGCRDKMKILLPRASADIRALWLPLLEPWLVTNSSSFVRSCSWMRSRTFLYHSLKKERTFMEMWAKCEENKVLRLMDDALSRRLLALEFPPPMPKHAANLDGTLHLINPNAGAWTHYLREIAFVHCTASSCFLSQYKDVLCQHEAKRSEAVRDIICTAAMHMDNLFGELLRVHFANLYPVHILDANVDIAVGGTNFAPDGASATAANEALCVFRRLIPTTVTLGVPFFIPTGAETAHSDRIFIECESCVSMLEILSAASVAQTRGWSHNKDLLVWAASADDASPSLTTICGAPFVRASTLIQFRVDIRGSLTAQMERDICASLAPYREQVEAAMGNGVSPWSPALAIRDNTLKEIARNVRAHGCDLVRVTRAHTSVDADYQELQQAALSSRRRTSGMDLESLICEVACVEVLMLFGVLCDFAIGTEKSGDNPGVLGIMLDSTTVLNEQVYF